MSFSDGLGGVISFLSITVYYLLVYFLQYNISLLFYAGIFSFWCMFFVLGQKIGMGLTPVNVYTSFVIVLIGLLLSVLETRLLYQYYGQGIGVKFSTFILSYGVISILLNPIVQNRFNPNRKVFRIFSFLGNNSLGIYYIHCYIISAIALLYSNLFWGIKAVIVLLISVGIIILMKKLSPTVSSYLGFR